MSLAALIVAIVALGIATIGLTGCTSKPDGSVGPLVQKALDALLPADFHGSVDTGHSNAVFDFSIKAGNVRKNATGQWTWDWLQYKRNSHYATWSSNGWITLGTPPQ